MVRFKQIILLTLIIALLSGCSKLPFRKENQGAIQVTSNQTMMVYLNDTPLGQSPLFDETIKIGEYIVKLEPLDNSLPGWQTKLAISPRALTVVDYQVKESGSSKYVMQLVPIAGSDTRMSLTTLPNNAVIKINDEVKGFSPITLDNLPSGDYVIVISAPGYETKTINAKTTPGYHLITQVELARDGYDLKIEPEKTATESAQPLAPEDTTSATNITESKPTTLNFKVENGIVVGSSDGAQLNSDFARILEASPGINWLRVRKEPSGITNNEVAKVRINTYFPYLGISPDKEWVQIKFGEADADTGWVASQYVQVTEID